MSSHRQLPEVFRRLHPQLQDAVARRCSSSPGFFSILFMLPGNVDFIGRMYAFGAMLSFTIAHAVGDPAAAQAAAGRGALPRPAELHDPRRQLAALRDLRRARHRRSPGSSSSIQDAPTRYAGLGWLAAGFVFYVIYRRRLGIPLHRDGASRRSSSGRRSRSSTGRSSSRSSPGSESHEAIDLAARLAAERGATIVALRVIVVPLDRPLDADAAGRGGGGRPAARRGARSPRPPTASGRSTASSAPATPGARSSTRRRAARRRSSCSAPRAAATAAIFGDTVDYVLKNAPCRVMVAAGKRAA